MNMRKVRTRILIWSLIAMLLPLALLVACGDATDSDSAPDRQSDDTSPDDNQADEDSSEDVSGFQLLEFLRYVPDTQGNKAWITYGDAVAWHSAWNIRRFDSLTELQEAVSDEDVLAGRLFLYASGRQLQPPTSLGAQYVLMDDMRGTVGFDLFTLDQYLSAGWPPDTLTMATYNSGRDSVESALRTEGYSEDPRGDATLFASRDDYEVDIQASTKIRQMAWLNRIMVDDDLLLIGSATKVIDDALDAYEDPSSNLAEDPAFRAAALAMADDELAQFGPLVAVILIDGEKISEMLEGQPAAGTASLPPFDLAFFATYQKSEETYLVLGIVLDEDIALGEDAAAEAADILLERLGSYESLRRIPLEDRWSPEDTMRVTTNGRSIALAVMHAPTIIELPSDENPIGRTLVTSWIELVAANDILFLAP
jgi:hypothetical protein